MNSEAILAGKPETNVLSPSDEWQATTVGLAISNASDLFPMCDTTRTSALLAARHVPKNTRIEEERGGARRGRRSRRRE